MQQIPLKPLALANMLPGHLLRETGVPPFQDPWLRGQMQSLGSRVDEVIPGCDRSTRLAQSTRPPAQMQSVYDTVRCVKGTSMTSWALINGAIRGNQANKVLEQSMHIMNALIEYFLHSRIQKYLWSGHLDHILF